MSACLPAQVLFLIMYTDPESAYHQLNNLFEYPAVIDHFIKLLAIILVDRLRRIIILICSVDGTILACYFIN